MKTIGKIADKVFYEVCKLVGLGILFGVPMFVVWTVYHVLTK